MPFLAVCPGCNYSQICVLPESTFPRIKCCRCREVYDPIGSEDTDVIPALAGDTVGRRMQEARLARLRTETKRPRRRKADRVGRVGPAAARPGHRVRSGEAVAFAVSPGPEVGPVTAAAPPESARDTEPDVAPWGTAPESAPPSAPAPAGPPVRQRTGRRAGAIVPASTPLTAGALVLLGGGLLVSPVEGVGWLYRPLALASVLLSGWAIRSAARDRVAVRYAVAVLTLAVAALLGSFCYPRLAALNAG